jgi:heterodisulfide reductase subunit D
MKLENIVDEFSQCNKCGLCLANCPISKELLLEKFSPRGRIQLARYYSQDGLKLSDNYREIFARCLLCGACTVTCPSGVDLKRVFLRMRKEIAEGRGLHPNMERLVDSLGECHNISEEDNEERGDWRDDVREIPDHRYEKEMADVAFFVGCVSSFFPMVQNIPQSLVKIFENTGVNFSILAGDEWCCGFPLIGAGMPDKLKALKEHNLEKVEAMGVGQVVFSCPSCHQTWKETYDTDLGLYHSTQFIEQMIEDGSLLLNEMDMTVTYHDPCDLGRHGGIFESPRKILSAIPGLTLVELEDNRAKSVCCGGGGNLEVADADLSGTVAQKKIEEIQKTGAKTVITSCQQCVRTIKSRARRQKIDLDVVDITEFILQAIQSTP